MSRPNPDSPLTRYEVVNQVAKIWKDDLDTEAIPFSWFKELTLPSGRVDLTAILILGEVVYWHRPSKKLAEPETWVGGESYDYTKRFKGEKYHLHIGDTAEKFGLGEGTVSEAVKRLEGYGLVEREESTERCRFWTESNPTTKIYLTVIPEALAKITYHSRLADPVAVETREKATSAGERGPSPGELPGSAGELASSASELPSSLNAALHRVARVRSRVPESEDFKDSDLPPQGRAPAPQEEEPSAPPSAGASEPLPPATPAKVASLPAKRGGRKMPPSPARKMTPNPEVETGVEPAREDPAPAEASPPVAAEPDDSGPSQPLKGCDRNGPPPPPPARAKAAPTAMPGAAGGVKVQGRPIPAGLSQVVQKASATHAEIRERLATPQAAAPVEDDPDEARRLAHNKAVRERYARIESITAEIKNLKKHMEWQCSHVGSPGAKETRDQIVALEQELKNLRPGRLPTARPAPKAKTKANLPTEVPPAVLAARRASGTGPVERNSDPKQVGDPAKPGQPEVVPADVLPPPAAPEPASEMKWATTVEPVLSQIEEPPPVPCRSAAIAARLRAAHATDASAEADGVENSPEDPEEAPRRRGGRNPVAKLVNQV